MPAKAGGGVGGFLAPFARRFRRLLICCRSRSTDPCEPRVRDFLTTHSRISAGSVVHVITGKSTAVLLELVRDMLDDAAADHVDEYAGMLGGGGWVVRVK